MTETINSGRRPRSLGASWVSGLGLSLLSALALACEEVPPTSGTGGLPGGSGGASAGGTASGGVGPGTGGAGPSSGGVGPGSGGAGPGSGGAGPGSGGAAPGSGGGGGGTTPDGLTDFSNKTQVTCNLNILSSMISPDISTVGIVEFTADLAGVSDAFIQFGETTAYTLEAPVDLAEPNYRTLLLGMVTNLEHHYRIVVTSDTEACVSPDQTITTGLMPAGGGIGNAAVSAGSSSAPVEPGFFSNGTYNSEWIYILNQDGALVWYFPSPFPNPTRARLSWDGKFMWVRDGNPGGAENMGQIAKIAMDGSSSSVQSVPTSHHDLSVLPDGSIVYIKKNPSGTCDAIYRHAGDGENYAADTMVFDVATAFSGGTCHSNSLHYHDSDGSFTISDLNHDAYVKVSSAGEVEWVLGGGQNSDFTGPGATWERQHGHHLLADDTLLFFNNGTTTSVVPSPVKEVTLNFGDMSAENGFTYESDACSGPCLSQFMGDVQRLPGGNTFVTYSSMGIVHEVDPQGELIRSFDLPDTSAGYSEHRPTLYGRPPR